MCQENVGEMCEVLVNEPVPITATLGWYLYMSVKDECYVAIAMLIGHCCRLQPVIRLYAVTR